MKEIKEYNLRITEKQAKRIMFALDLYTRLSAGQMNILNEITFEKDKEGTKVQSNRETLELLQKEMFPSLDGLHHSYGIHSKGLPDEIREVYDIFKVMMYEFNKDKGAMNVYADKVRQASKQLLPLFEEVRNLKEEGKK
ncbi:hypothetical protein LCGC14_1092260 [marine sediment metagenome]|uniref:Uncharacterized protein n=1 Tax=marine sediment metagenome TaxID=412755 RepID=A0A0F9QI15_9ZZZZ